MNHFENLQNGRIHSFDLASGNLSIAISLTDNLWVGYSADWVGLKESEYHDKAYGRCTSVRGEDNE